MRKLLIAIGLVTMSFGSVVGATFAYAQASPTNCKTVEGPGYFAQACGTNAQVSAGPGGSSASTGPEQLTNVIPSPSPSPTASPLATPSGTFTPVPSVVQPTPTASPPAQRPAPAGLIGMLLRLLGLG